MSDAYVAASVLATATYCPRQLYYARREDDLAPPPEVAETQALADRYPELLDASDAELADLPLCVTPDEYRANLTRLAERPYWDELVDPSGREVLLTGKDCRGIAHKVLEMGGGEEEEDDKDGEAEAESETAQGPPPIPTLVSAGEPAGSGVWAPQSVRAVAIAKMLAWERSREIPRAFVEYPAAGVVREVKLSVRRTARYRGVLRTVQAMDGPPARIRDTGKCKACDYRTECGVRTRSLRSLVGL